MRIATNKRTFASLRPSTIMLLVISSPASLLGSYSTCPSRTDPVTPLPLHFQERGRLIPPSGLSCDRNDLTLYDGRALTYHRNKGRTYLRIRTNFDTTEAVTIRHPGTDDPSQFFLLNAEPFAKNDWRLIEKRKGVLKPGMRANVWVCRGNPAIQPVVDWRPDDAGAYPKSR